MLNSLLCLAQHPETNRELEAGTHVRASFQSPPDCSATLFERALTKGTQPRANAFLVIRARLGRTRRFFITQQGKGIRAIRGDIERLLRQRDALVGIARLPRDVHEILGFLERSRGLRGLLDTAFVEQGIDICVSLVRPLEMLSLERSGHSCHRSLDKERTRVDQFVVVRRSLRPQFRGFPTLGRHSEESQSPELLLKDAALSLSTRVVNEARTNRVPKDWQSGSRLATAPPTPSRIFSYEGYVRMLSEGTEQL